MILMLNRLDLTRGQILSFRRQAGALDARLPFSEESLRLAAWAGLQDSMPRAALLSIHARVAGAGPTAWEHPSLVQLWGPRFTVYTVAARDRAVFSLGTLPDAAKGRARAADLAARLHAVLDGSRLDYAQAGDRLGVRNANLLRYAAATGTVLLRWEGARRPVIWTVPAPSVDPADARLELARRYLRVFGPATAESFGEWSGTGPRGGAAAFALLGDSLLPVRTPIGDAWILASDEADVRAGASDGVSSSGSSAVSGGGSGDLSGGVSDGAVSVRLLPSGDPYLLLQGADRSLVVPDAGRRGELWTPRVWPGGLLIDGEVAGTWRRADAVLTVQPWRRLSDRERDAVVAEAEALPLPGVEGRIVVRWGD
jgi:hypothetical protein